jgi:hypothetical protein
MEYCEFCRAEIPAEHAHLLDVAGRRLACACRTCALAFAGRVDAAYRAVPSRVQAMREFYLTDSEWSGFHIPIDMAFLFHSTPQARPIALYPGPAGAAEQAIGVDAWAMLIANNPTLADLSPDVEALLVNRLRGRRDYYRASIDHCYALVGLIRANWRGLSGGGEVWDLIDSFFAQLRLDGDGLAEQVHD